MFDDRSSHTATLLPDGTVLVAGGVGGGGGLLTAEIYDVSRASWMSTGDMLEDRDSHTATLLRDGRVLVAGGFGLGPGGHVGQSGLLGSAELFDPVTGTWSATVPMVEGREHHTATLLPDGRVLVAGGHVRGGQVLASAEAYAPMDGS